MLLDSPDILTLTELGLYAIGTVLLFTLATGKFPRQRVFRHRESHVHSGWYASWGFLS